MMVWSKYPMIRASTLEPSPCPILWLDVSPAPDIHQENKTALTSEFEIFTKNISNLKY